MHQGRIENTIRGANNETTFGQAGHSRGKKAKRNFHAVDSVQNYGLVGPARMLFGWISELSFR
jgi:hypothetical protein